MASAAPARHVLYEAARTALGAAAAEELMASLVPSGSDLATKQDLERFATKDDLQRFATKDDLERLTERFATKDDLQRFATKDDLERLTERFATKQDLERFPTKDEVSRLVLTAVGVLSGTFALVTTAVIAVAAWLVLAERGV
jgi:hypothetical protein